MMQSTDADRQAIIDLIERETSAYFAKDFEAWSDCWVHEPYAQRVGWYARGGKIVNRGWEQEAATMRAAMEAYPAPNRSQPELRREELTIRISSDMAWVTFRQVAPKTGDPFDVPGHQHEARILERHDGAWKIACTFVVGSEVAFFDSPVIGVDDQSRVQWMSEAASALIGEHRNLTILGGRLRARHRSSDERLQASIGWAAGLTNYAALQAAATTGTARSGALPVMLGDVDEATADVCWVIADSGTILVSFIDPGTIEHRLEAAAVIYGITAAQRRLAAEIIAGHDLAEAARRIGVSVNTARTQLQRMFDKTGVRGQPALVRVLLSAISPIG